VRTAQHNRFDKIRISTVRLVAAVHTAAAHAALSDTAAVHTAAAHAALSE